MIECSQVISEQDRKGAYKLRYAVFVEEQKVPEDMELDEFDDSAIHAIAKENGQIIGTGRLVREENKGRIGRLAVNTAFRGKGIGKLLMHWLENMAIEQGLSELYLHAQVYALPFYEKLGYQTRGQEFDEAGITHIEMYKTLAK